MGHVCQVIWYSWCILSIEKDLIWCIWLSRKKFLMSFAHQEIFFLTFLNHQRNHNPRITFAFTFFLYLFNKIRELFLTHMNVKINICMKKNIFLDGLLLGPSRNQILPVSRKVKFVVKLKVGVQPLEFLNFCILIWWVLCRLKALAKKDMSLSV